MQTPYFFGRIGIVVLWTGILFFVLALLSDYSFIPEGKEITVFAWGDMFDEDIIAEFEHETGITVNLSVYQTNEELLAKLRTLEGSGYDLVVPSDYVVGKLISEGLVQPIDKQKLDFYDAINPVLLGHFFDPENRYAIPFEWELYGIGVNTQCFSREYLEQDPWRFVFEPHTTILQEDPHSVAMSNDPVEAIVFAAHYLFGPVTSLTKEQQQMVVDVLKKQRRYVEAYSNDRSEYYLATNNCCVSLSQSSLIWRAMRTYDTVDFHLPRENGFVTIEHCVIPIGSHKTEYVYQFLNHVYTRDSFKRHFHKYLFIPARQDVIDELDATAEQKQIMRSSPERFANYHFVRDIVPDTVKNRMWIEIKS